MSSPAKASAAGPAPAAPILEVEKLTVRFGGLTAVSEVDLRVNRGEIFAVIGPNGAGKTTVFNTISGIYEPSAGQIRFKGAELRTPLSPILFAWWTLIGLFVGTVLLVFVSNVDAMWSTVIKQNYRGPESGFSVTAAWRDLTEYMAAAPRTEQRVGRFFVISHDGAVSFGAVRTAEEAEARRAAAADVIALRGSEATIEQRGDTFAILSADRARALEPFATREDAAAMVRDAARAGAASQGARRARLVVFLLGTLVGAAGAFAVWSQTRRTPAWIASQCVARTFQNIRLFQEMTVLENVLTGMDRHLTCVEPWYSRGRLLDFAIPAGLALSLVAVSLSLRGAGATPAAASGVLLALFVIGTIVYVARIGRLGAFSRHDLQIDADARAEARNLLAFVGLEAKADEVSKNLAYGDQRRLEIARALATRPELLLLDEPAAGMNPAETVSLMRLIREIRDRRVTVLLIEHHMRVVMGISDRIAVLEYGRKIAEGTPEEVRGDPRVIEAYLGKEELG